MSIDVGTAVGYLDLDTSRWNAGFANASQQLNTLMDSTQSAGTRFQATGQLMQQAGSTLTKAITLPFVGLGVAAVNTSMKTETSMAKVNSILQLGGKEFSSYKNVIKDGANDIGLAYDKYADSAYEAISSGVKQTEVTKFLTGANKLAKGGLTDLANATNLLTTVQNAYGLEQKDLAHVSDVLIQTQNLGKITVDELASSMGKIIPTAKGLGVSVDQLGAGYSIMTAKGIQGAEATTYMNSMFNELGKSGTKVDKILKETTGKSFKGLMDSGKSTGDVLQILSDEAKKSGLSLTDLFGSAEAGKAALTLLNNGSSEFNGVLKEMQNSSGATDRAFKELEKTSKDRLLQAIDKLKNALSDLGDALLPLVADMTEATAKFAVWASNMARVHPELTKITVVIMGILAALGPLLIFFGSIAGAIGNLMPVFTKLRTGFLLLKTLILDSLIPALGSLWTFMLANPITLVIAAVVALVAGFVYLWNTSAGFKQSWIDMWNTIVAGTQTAITAIGQFFLGLGTGINTIFNNMVIWASQAIANVVIFFQELPAKIGEVWTNVLATITLWCTNIGLFFTTTIPQWIQGIVNWFNQLPAQLGFALGFALGTIDKWGVSVWTYLSTNVPKWIEGISKWFSEMPGKVWNWLNKSIQDIIKWGTQIFTNASTWTTKTITGIVTFFSTLPGNIWTWLVQAIAKVVAWGTQTYAQGVAAATRTVNAIGTYFAQLPGKVWTWLAQTISKMASFVVQMAAKGTAAAVQTSNNIVNGLKAIPGKVTSIGSNIVKGLWAGIQSSAGWLRSQITGFANGIINGFKAAFQIHSPSRVMRDLIGVNLIKGIGVGMDQEMPNLKKTLTKSVSTINDTMQIEVKKSNNDISKEYNTGTQNITNTIDAMWKRNQVIWSKGSSDILKIENEHSKKLQDITTKRDRAITEAQKKYAEDKKKTAADKKRLQDSILKADQAFADSKKKIDSDYSESLTSINNKNLEASKDYYANMDNIKREYTQKTTELDQKFKEEQQKLTDDYTKIFEDRTKSLMGWTSIFAEVQRKEEATTGSKLTDNLRDQVDTFETWATDLENLKKRIGDNLYSALLDQGPQAFEEIEAISEMTDKQLAKYEALYEKKRKLAEQQSLKDTKADKDRITKELEELRKTYDTEYQELARKLSEDVEKQLSTIKDKFGLIPPEMMKTGTDMIKGLVTGLNSAREELYKNIDTIGVEISKRLGYTNLMNVGIDSKQSGKLTNALSSDLANFMSNCEGAVKQFLLYIENVTKRLIDFFTFIGNLVLITTNTAMLNIKNMCIALTLDLNTLATNAIKAWDKIREAYAKDIVGVIRIKTIVEEEGETVTKSTGKSQKSLSSILQSLSYSDQAAQANSQNTNTSSKVNVDIDYIKLAKTIADNTKANVSIANTYNSPKPASVSELKKQDEIQMRRLAMQFNL